MQPLLIPCPNCGKELKLPDRRLLGRKAKCRNCGHRFLLEEPDEVELQLADETPAVGTSAEWVPDEVPGARGDVAAAAIPQIQVTDPAPTVRGKPRSRAARLRRQRQKKLWITVGSAVSGLLVAVLVFAGIRSGNQSRPERPRGDEKTRPSVPTENHPAVPAVAVEDDTPPPDAPKAEGPIDLKAIPPGAHVIIHLRPAELWKPGSDAETVRLCLGPLGPWAEAKLKELLLFEPKQIEEAVICLYLFDRTRPPDVACRVKLVERQKPSTFFEKFAGKRDAESGRVVYVRQATAGKPGRAFMITDKFGTGFASAPLSMRPDMENTFDEPGLPDGSLDQLLQRTDRGRQLTVLFDPRTLRDFKRQLFPQELDPLLEQFLVRFEDGKIEGAAWSFYFGGPKYADLYSEILLRNSTGFSPRQLRIDMRKKLENLPEEVAGLVRKMRPRLVSEQKLVSRLPIMLQAFNVETVSTTGTDNDRYVKLTTALPRIAGPNLAAGSTLAWRLALATDFSKPAPPPTTGRKVPELVADRLKTTIEIDFRQVPLQEAFEYIGEETSVKVLFDDKALQNGGITKNKPMNFKLGRVPGTAALKKISSQFTGPGRHLVVVIDEPKKAILVTTETFAKKKGQTPHPLGP